MLSARPAGDISIHIRGWVVAGGVAVRSGPLLIAFGVHAALDVPLFYAVACRWVT